MPPRGFTNPAPKTESAREAVRSFYCELCSKGYARMNEYEAHLSSYDHSHKQRLKDMRQLSKDPNRMEKARKQEKKADSQGLISIKIGDEGAKKGGFKKSGFKSAFVAVESGDGVLGGEGVVNEGREGGKGEERRGVEGESDTEDEGYEMYDPRYPTD